MSFVRAQLKDSGSHFLLEMVPNPDVRVVGDVGRGDAAAAAAAVGLEEEDFSAQLVARVDLEPLIACDGLARRVRKRHAAGKHTEILITRHELAVRRERERGEEHVHRDAGFARLAQR